MSRSIVMEKNGLEIFGRLPIEMVSLVFSHGARMSTKFAHSLCLVAQWTRAVALPHLYSAVVVHTMPQKQLFLNTLKMSFTCNEHPYIFTPKDHLRNLWVEPTSNQILDMLRLSDSVTNLALSVDNLYWIVENPTIFSKRPKTNNIRLLLLRNFNLDWMFSTHSWPENPPSLLECVTHIQLTEEEYHMNLIASGMDRYPNLTHLAIPCRPILITQQAFQDLMRHTFLTHFVIVIYTDSRSGSEQASILNAFRELRSVYSKLLCIKCEKRNLRGDWENEARGGRTFWQRAEDFTATILLPDQRNTAPPPNDGPK